MIIIHNQYFEVKISPNGAEMKSMRHQTSNTELLYAGNTSYWNRSAPVLFPIVGKLKDNLYYYQGKEYHMSQHGFARDMEFQVQHQTDESVTFVLENNASSQEKYPFQFQLRLIYALKKEGVIITYSVFNKGDKIMPFSIGAHPGFNIPWDQSSDLENYSLYFPQTNQLIRHHLDPQTGLYNQKTSEINLEENQLKLQDALFTEDAIVIKKPAFSEVTLTATPNKGKLRYQFPDFPYFAIWKKPNAPFLCLEPWFGLADSNTHNQEITEKEGIILLEPNQKFECQQIIEYSE